MNTAIGIIIFIIFLFAANFIYLQSKAGLSETPSGAPVTTGISPPTIPIVTMITNYDSNVATAYDVLNGVTISTQRTFVSSGNVDGILYEKAPYANAKYPLAVCVINVGQIKNSLNNYIGWLIPYNPTTMNVYYPADTSNCPDGTCGAFCLNVFNTTNLLQYIGIYSGPISLPTNFYIPGSNQSCCTVPQIEQNGYGLIFTIS